MKKLFKVNNILLVAGGLLTLLSACNTSAPCHEKIREVPFTNIHFNLNSARKFDNGRMSVSQRQGHGQTC